MKNIEGENIHEHHRRRLTKLIFDAGVENVTEVQALEFLLFFGIPRCDTNPLAHRLLNKFGSIDKVIDADINDLCSVQGVGDQCAMRIKLLPEILEHYYLLKSNKKQTFETLGKLYDYFETALRMKDKEHFIMLALNNRFQVLESKTIEGAVDTAKTSKMEFSTFLTSSKALLLVVAHNHPGGSCSPSTQDIKTTDDLKMICNILGVKFLDHLIIGADGIFSFSNSEKVREY